MVSQTKEMVSVTNPTNSSATRTHSQVVVDSRKLTPEQTQKLENFKKSLIALHPDQIAKRLSELSCNFDQPSAYKGKS